jgi:hypothetical protein
LPVVAAEAVWSKVTPANELPSVRRVIRAARTSLPLARSFNDVLNLVEPPTSRARPGVVGRVVAASIHQRRHPVTVTHPRVAPPT